MTALAPPLAGPLAGACPHCAAAVPIRFDPRAALRAGPGISARAGFVAEEIDTLAAGYPTRSWSERAILDLPGPRRAAYADMARRAAA